MGGFALVCYGGKRGVKGRARSEHAAQLRQQAWVAKHRAQTLVKPLRVRREEPRP